MAHFNQCLTLAPSYRPGYVKLAEFHLDADRPREGAEVYRRWIERTPNDLEALLFLSTHFIARDEPLQARNFAERAQSLKPLDKAIGNLLWSTYVKAARQFACRGQFDQARDELATADRLQPDRKNDYDMLARKAVLETKAGNLKAARPFIEQALEVIAEPTALWLVMTIEAIRFDLPNKETWLYEKRWQDALKRRCRGETAGLMCQMLNAHLVTPQPYESCDEHVQLLLKYVRRYSRVKWQVEDLRNVCDFLDTAQEYSLLEKLVKRGVRSFPRAAYLHWFAAQTEIEKGPRRCDRNWAIEHLQEAVRLGTSSGDPRDQDVVDNAKQARTFLSDVSLGVDADDDDADDDDADEGNFDDLMDDLEGIPRNVILDMIQRQCKQMGLNPEEVTREIERRQAAGSRRTRGRK